MEIENKDQKVEKENKITVKRINTIFGPIAFGLVFIFTFLLISTEIKEKHMVEVGASFGAAFGVVVILYIIFMIIAVKRSKTENDKEIQKAIDQIEDIREKESKSEN